MKKVLLSGLLFCLTAALLTGAGHTEPAKQESRVKENHMSGIVFFKTQKLKELQSFYVEQVGCTLWLDQGGCIILRHGNFLFGFCQREESETCGMLTFFYKEKEEVDRMYKKFKAIADAAPKENKKYDIYHFFARDPEGRAIEFQYFLNPIDWNF